MSSRAAFAFGERVMERRYQHFYLSSSIDRIRPIICYIIFIRFSFLLYAELHAPKWDRAKLMFMTIRIFFLISILAIVSAKCGRAFNYWRGLTLLWIARMCSVLVALEYTALDYGTLHNTSTLANFVCLSGLVFPRFTEYFLFSVSLSVLRPWYLFLRSSSPESIFDLLYQHALILALGASITWTVHADHRRDWLRSRTGPARASGSDGQRSAERRRLDSIDVDSADVASSTSEAATGMANGLNLDDSIAADSAEMRELAWQVLANSHHLPSLYTSVSCKGFAP